MDARHTIDNTQTDKPFVYHAVRHSIRAGFDFLILFLLLRAVEAVKNRTSIKDHPWATCFTVATLYLKLSNTLNPLRDKMGIYRYFMGEKEESENSIDTQTRPTVNIFSGSPVLAQTNPKTESPPANLKLN